MPIYVYACTKCENEIEVHQNFSDEPISRCEACGGSMYRVIQPTTVIYNASGFYSSSNKQPKRKDA